MAFLSKGITDIDKDYYKPIAAENKDFPHFPNMPTYCVKVYLPLEINPVDAAERVALMTGINQDYIGVHVKGEKLDWGTEDETKPVKYKAMASTKGEFNATTDGAIVDNAQDEVGSKRIGSFMKELEADRKEREKLSGEFKIEESFVVSHHVAPKIVGRPVRKGYYFVESTGTGVQVWGPYKDKPINYPMYNTIMENAGLELVSDTKKGDIRLFELRTTSTPHQTFAVDHERNRSEMTKEKQPFEVEVLDTNTGRRYTVYIKAFNQGSARTKGVNAVAQREKLNQGTLVATKPERPSSVIGK